MMIVWEDIDKEDKTSVEWRTTNNNGCTRCPRETKPQWGEKFEQVCNARGKKS